jgi:type IV pilus assembly protein PilA
VSTFCATCGKGMNADERFCSACGTPVSSNSTVPQVLTTPAVPIETSGKAIVSLIFGLFFFFFPFSVVAIIFGHLSLSEIRKSAGRLKGNGLATAGLILGYGGLVAIPMILIIAAIAIPNLLRARMAANESSAVASIRTISTAEITYSASSAGNGFTCNLSDLSLSPSDGLRHGVKNGYAFRLSDCTPGTGDSGASYKVVAYPVAVNQTGMRAFCSDESNVIRVDAGGSAQNCLQSGVPLQ